MWLAVDNDSNIRTLENKRITHFKCLSLHQSNLHIQQYLKIALYKQVEKRGFKVILKLGTGEREITKQSEFCIIIM
jgi:hypothetical protein